MKNTIITKIMESEKFENIKKAYEYVTTKFGKGTVIAGGALVDCFYKKEFYDIDCFVYIDDLKEEHKFNINTVVRDRIMTVIRDKYQEFDLDIVVLGIKAIDHIEHFDICQKMIWYDGEEIHVHDKAVKDIESNTVSLNAMTNDFHWFRLIRAAEKYDMKINSFDDYILNNYLSYSIKNNLKLYISQKYEKYINSYEAYEDNNKEMYYAVKNCIKNNIYNIEKTIYQDQLKEIISDLF